MYNLILLLTLIRDKHKFTKSCVNKNIFSNSKYFLVEYTFVIFGSK